MFYIVQVSYISQEHWLKLADKQAHFFDQLRVTLYFYHYFINILFNVAQVASQLEEHEVFLMDEQIHSFQ